ncbi:hypothetical protein EGW08_019259 [Elysia chlorotica]|uniref:G-protein coupled receptors family 2 profile 2 domain-containing protein n=1 Tax=Elysia chlorotica TaxID=188477 RepID=A0A3S0ZA21_ELYCH|nr:hypothetical protein EGW08_019259 [Elysia chlorotica]
MFCWMLVEGIHLYVVLVRVFKHGSHIRKYSALGWGVPLIIVGISVGVFSEKYGTGRLCWLDSQPLLICFAPTVGLVLMAVDDQEEDALAAVGHREQVAGLKATLVLLPLLGLTWSLAFLAIRRDQSEGVSYIFTYLFTVTNSCQGVFFLVVHCLLNVDVHQAYERRFSRKKRLSTADTTSSRLRKFSENDIFSGTNKISGTTTTRSTLTDLSVVLPRLSFMGHTRLTNGDKHPIIGPGRVRRLDFAKGRLPEPDYPRQQDFPEDDRFGLDNPIIYPSHQDQRARDDVISELMTSRPQRNSVRFSNDSDVSF